MEACFTFAFHYTLPTQKTQKRSTQDWEYYLIKHPWVWPRTILFYFIFYSFLKHFLCAFQLAKKIQFLWSAEFCHRQTLFLITISTRISVFFEVAGKVKRAATMRSSYSLCSLRPLLFICIWVTDGCVVCVGQSPGGQRVEGRRVGGFHGQKLEANGKCKTFWGVSLFFFSFRFHLLSPRPRSVPDAPHVSSHAPDPLGSR